MTLGSRTVPTQVRAVSIRTSRMAATNPPRAATGSALNADNEMAAFNGTTLTYDADGNLTNDGTNTYTWDARGHLSTLAGTNVAVYQYDGLNRLVFAGYGSNGSGQYQSTIAYTYDAGDRLTQAIDSIARTIARSYDGLDDLTEEQTPQGAVTYTYDLAGRRLSMAAASQATVKYAWDNANRLTGITQGGHVGKPFLRRRRPAHEAHPAQRDDSGVHLRRGLADNRDELDPERERGGRPRIRRSLS